VAAFIGIITAYLCRLSGEGHFFSFPMETPLTAVILSLCLFHGCGGSFFGIFPAMRAAKLDPD